MSKRQVNQKKSLRLFWGSWLVAIGLGISVLIPDRVCALAAAVLAISATACWIEESIEIALGEAEAHDG